MRNQFSASMIVAVFVSSMTQGAWAGTVESLTSFSAGTRAVAAEVNANFQALETAVNDNANEISFSHSFGGDGTAGDLEIFGDDEDWTRAAPDNTSFNDITIGVGRTLTVPAGTTIRCRGTFTNNGKLLVDGGAQGGFQSIAVDAFTIKTTHPHPGDSLGAAGFGDAHINRSLALSGGIRGKAIPKAVAQTSFDNFRIGGGGGTSRFASGGGLVKIYCSKIVNNGLINANGIEGFEGGGGGGGGIVILGAHESINNSALGTIEVKGGKGGGSDSSTASGGGGGGGIIVMVSPSISSAGRLTVSGGARGFGSPVSSKFNVAGGGGGGACGGFGGAGGYIVGAGPVPGRALQGISGYSIQIFNNPAEMM